MLQQKNHFSNAAIIYLKRAFIIQQSPNNIQTIFFRDIIKKIFAKKKKSYVISF